MGDRDLGGGFGIPGDAAGGRVEGLAAAAGTDGGVVVVVVVALVVEEEAAEVEE